MTAPPLIGKQIGGYLIRSLLGAGGMGEVYRATDTALARDVAVKVLPASFACDPDRLQRFEREARMLAALNHPHVAAIYGVEKIDGLPAIILELVDGPTLADRISSGSMAVRDVLLLAGQIAEALEAAHARGIVHRDLKPANIKLTTDGRVKVLDFGLAKMLLGESAPDQSQSPTVTAAHTRDGIILGTAAYMSPEQARGQAVDKRTDLWAFGSVLYEMLTGRPPFRRDTVSDTIAAILDSEPDWSLLPAKTPAPIRTLLRRCLEKDGKRRLDSAAVAQLEIRDALGSPAAEPHAPLQRKRRLALLAAAWTGGAVVAALVTAWLMRGDPIRTLPAVLRFTIVAPATQAPAVPEFRRSIAISPDGRYIAYIGGRGGLVGPLMVRRLDQLDPLAIPGITAAAEPAFSPDSQWIAFFDPDNNLKKVPVAGGDVVQVARSSAAAGSPSWADDNSIVFSTLDPATGLLRVSANGGEPIALTHSDHSAHEADHTSGSVMPRGRGVLFAIDADDNSSYVAVLDLKNGGYKRLMPGVSPRYVEFADGGDRVGYVVFGSEGTLRAVQFDSSRLELVGEPVSLAEHVHTTSTRKVNFAVSQTGTLVYMPVSEPPARLLVWVDGKGRVSPVSGAPLGPYEGLRLSPDGSRAVFIVSRGGRRVATWNFASGTLTPVTFGAGGETGPVWTQDGSAIVFGSTRAGTVYNLFRQAADGSGTVERLTTSGNQQYATDVLPDGSRVLGWETRNTGGVIMLFPSRAKGSVMPESILQRASSPRLSPNGRFLAYESSESGRREIVVRPFPRVDDGRWQVSTAGGSRVAWSGNGRELFYLDMSDAMMTVPTETGGDTFRAGAPVKLFDASFARSNDVLTYDASADGQRFLVAKPEARPADAMPTTLVVVTNCFSAFTSPGKRR